MTTHTREIKYSRETRDYDAWLNGQYVGSFRTYHEAEVELDKIVYEQLKAGIDVA